LALRPLTSRLTVKMNQLELIMGEQQSAINLI
jgi:hypothetical protein